MPNTLENLRQIIDEQDLVKLQRFIAGNQQISYDNIFPNGASALWWALMPPLGKKANKAIIDYLLNARKNDGSHLVNPIQTFSGLTPRHYLRYTPFNGTSEVVEAIERAENHYVRPQRDPANVRNLAAIAADKQSAHDATVGTLTRANIIRLHQHYVKDNSNSLNEKTVEMTGNDIEAFLDALQKKQRVDAEQMRYGLDFCYSNTDPFAFQPSEENSEAFSLSLAQLVTLNWIAAKEQDVDLLPADADNDEALVSRKKAILNILYDIATAYGKNSASCAGGACNRLGMALASQHKLIQASLKGEKITGEMAGFIVLRILGQAIARLFEDNKEVYWTVIRYMALDTEEESYQEIIRANKDALLSQMIKEDIDENYALASIKMLDYGYPLFNHKTSYQLAELMGMMHKFKLDLARFDDNTAFDNKINTAIEILAKERLKHSKSFESLKTTFGVSSDDKDLALEKHFILHWLELARRRQRTDDLHTFISAAKPSEFAEECFLLSFFSSNKEKLKRENPAQATWLESLTDEQIIDLMSALNKTSPNGVAVINDFMQQLLLKAMELGFTAYLTFENMPFVNKDLRAFDFSGVRLNNVSFKNCLLPLAGSNIHCQNVKMLDCHLPGTDRNTTSEEEFAYLFLKLCSDRNYVSSSLTIQFLLTQISKKLLRVHDRRGHTPLIWAARNGYIDIVKLILASDKCSQKLLEFNIVGNTALNSAVENNHTEIVKAILASDKCSQEALEQSDIFGKTALFIAARKKGHTETVKAILASDKCSQKVLEQADNNGNTALLIAVKKNNTDIVKAILTSDKCSQKALEQTNRAGDTALIMAARNGDTESAKAILASDKCSLKLLEHARANEKSVLRHIALEGGGQAAKVRKIFAYIAYQTLWESTESEEDKALEVLRDYCQGTAAVLSLPLFAHGHINRHHTDGVRNLLREHEQGDKKLSDILIELNQLPGNEDGSFAHRLRFIKSRLQPIEAEEAPEKHPAPSL